MYKFCVHSIGLDVQDDEDTIKQSGGSNPNHLLLEKGGGRAQFGGLYTRASHISVSAHAEFDWFYNVQQKSRGTRQGGKFNILHNSNIQKVYGN